MHGQWSTILLVISGVGETTKSQSSDETLTPNNGRLSPSEDTADRRLSRDIGIQAFSIDLEQEKSTKAAQTSTHTTLIDSTQQTELNDPLRQSLYPFRVTQTTSNLKKTHFHWKFLYFFVSDIKTQEPMHISWIRRLSEIRAIFIE